MRWILILARRIVGVALALMVGFLAAIVAFFAPVVVTGNLDILVIWGWFSPITVLPSAYFSGRFAYSAFDAQFTGDSTGGADSWRRLLGVSAIAIVLVATTGYFVLTHGDRDIRWSEEVKLSNGTTAIVGRRVKGNAFGHAASRPEEWLPSVYEIDLSALPALSGAPVWRAPLRPILIDKVPSGGWIVVAEPSLCGEWNEIGRPVPPYRAYELKGSKWTTLEVPQELIGLSANLLNTPRFTYEDSNVSAAEVFRRNTEGRRKDDWPVVEAVAGCQ